MLMVAVVQETLRVEVVGVVVAGVVVIELCVGLVCPSVVEVLVVVYLPEGILVPQLLVRHGVVENGGRGQFPCGVVIVKLHVETLRPVDLPDGVEFGVKGLGSSVFAYFVRHAVVRPAIVQRVRVVSLGAHGIGRKIPVKQAVVALFGAHLVGDAGLQPKEPV